MTPLGRLGNARATSRPGRRRCSRSASRSTPAAPPAGWSRTSSPRSASGSGRPLGSGPPPRMQHKASQGAYTGGWAPYGRRVAPCGARLEPGPDEEAARARSPPASRTGAIAAWRGGGVGTPCRTEPNGQGIRAGAGEEDGRLGPRRRFALRHFPVIAPSGVLLATAAALVVMLLDARGALLPDVEDAGTASRRGPKSQRYRLSWSTDSPRKEPTACATLRRSSLAARASRRPPV